jgi:hypothetical protein
MSYPLNTPRLMTLGGFSQSRAGMILFIVLMAMMVMLMAMMVWIRYVSAAQIDNEATTRQHLQLALMRSGERIAYDWIRQHGSLVVSPISGGGWTIAHDTLVVESGQAQVSVTVFDGWSGLPLPLIHARGSLRRLLPPSLSGIDIPNIIIPDEETLFSPRDTLESLPLSSSVYRFPTAQLHSGTWLRWNDGEASKRAVLPTSLRLTSTEPVLALIISPHSDGRINLNTAPLPLIEEVCRLRGIGVPEHLVHNRKLGVFTPAPAGNDALPGLPRLVDTSVVWNCLITTQWAGIERSWWVVLVGSDTNLHIIQRHDATP